MTTTTQIRKDKIKFDLIVSDDMPEFFADGISHMLMGNPITKLTFHSVTNPARPNNDGVEHRKGVLLLTMPTAVLLEVCRNILSSAQSSIDNLSEGGKKIDARILKIMDGVNIAQPPTMEQE